MVWLVLGGFAAVVLIAVAVLCWRVVVTVVMFAVFAIVRLVELAWVGIASLAGRRRKDRTPWTITEGSGSSVGPDGSGVPLWERPRTYEDDEVVYTRPPERV